MPDVISHGGAGSLSARVLPPAEWERLGVCGMPELFPYLQPADIKVVVVERGGEIMARLSFIRAPLLEGFWIAPDSRGNPAILRSLLRGVRDVVRGDGYGWAYAQSDQAHVADLLERGGGRKLPVDTYLMAVGE